MDMDNPGNRPEDAVPGTDYRSPAPFKAAVSRRRFLQVGGALAGAAAVGVGASQLGGLTGRSRAAAATGTMADLKHVVILMQENRSFDHYYGTLQGVRGFSDKQILKYQNGTTIFDQPDKQADRPRVPAALPHGLHQGGRAERGGPRPQLVR